MVRVSAGPVVSLGAVAGGVGVGAVGAGVAEAGVVGWARVSLSGDPCYFCAMLISRGAVYKTNASGTFDSSGDIYHTNCRCVAVPIYSTSQFETDPRYQQSRDLAAMWRTGMSLKEWRSLIDGNRQSGEATWIRQADDPAQVAG